jgi:lysophospholipase L1-like esterase
MLRPVIRRCVSAGLALSVAVAAMLVGCGGSGASTSADSTLSYVVASASVSVQADTSETTPRTATVGFVISHWSARPPGRSVTPRVTWTGVAVASASAVMDSTSAAGSVADSVTGHVTITLWPAGSLGAGAYSGSVSLTLCFDATVGSCVDMLAGGATPIPVTLTITGDPQPTTAVSLAPGGADLVGATADAQGPTVSLSLLMSQESPAPYTNFAQPAGGFLSSLDFQATGPSSGQLTIAYVAPQQLATGIHTETLLLNVCLDAQCQRPLRNSPLTVPLTYRVISSPALARWFQGGFSGKTVAVWGNSTVSNAVYFFQQLDSYTTAPGLLAGLNAANVLNLGNNGASLAALLDGQGPFPIDAVIAAQPDLLIIRGPLINDVRLGATNLQQAEQLLTAALDRIRAGSPRTDILLTTENSLLTTDVGGRGYVQPNAAAQQYTDIMHDAVMAMAGRYPNVEVYDIMSIEYGQTCQAASPLMADQLHPNEAGQRKEADLVAAVIGLPTD